MRTPSDRRKFLQAAAAGTAGLTLAQPIAQAAMGKGSDQISVAKSGTYEAVELAKPNVTLGVIQSKVRAVNASRHKREIRENLDHMLELIDNAFYYGGGPDILFFHEFPITGWKRWSREEILRFAIEVPGPETERISKKAKEYGCTIVFGSYVRDDDWPDHVLSVTSIIGPDGSVIDKHWKARNIKGVFPEFELFTTTVYDVLDQYVEMYGADAVIPITRTPLGNIATSSTQREPELFRAAAIKGAEIILRTATGGFTPLDMQATSLYNGVYTAVCNNAVSPNNPGFFDDAGSGGSAVYDPRGEVMASADTKFETMIRARLPMAEFRGRNRQPIVHMEMVGPVFEAYRNPYGPNLFSAYLPTDLEDAARFLKDKSQWK